MARRVRRVNGNEERGSEDATVRAYMKNGRHKNEAKAEKYRNLTKNYGREWLDYARASAQSTKSPLSLCVSAAGSTDFCEG